ncbi:hypothetical protein AHAS_Ahas02G0143800 [Arachis hypogaea]
MLVEERAANEARQVWFAESVLKFLMERNSVNVLHGQVTSGTLILQDCAVSLLFALLPVLGGTSGVLQGVTYMTKSAVDAHIVTNLFNLPIQIKIHIITKSKKKKNKQIWLISSASILFVNSSIMPMYVRVDLHRYVASHAVISQGLSLHNPLHMFAVQPYSPVTKQQVTY